MRRRRIRFLLGTFYAVLLAALLISHTRRIREGPESAAAVAETLLLAVPAVAILVLYVRVNESGEKENGSEEKGEAEIMTPEQLRERIGDFGLTRREWEIAWLLYCGYSNRQIAEEYCIAETTVKKHVSHIYEKLQVSGRKEFKEKYGGRTGG